MKPIILCALAVALVSSFSYGAGLPAADMNAAGDGTVDVSIKLYNKAVYFVDHTADNPILVNVTVKNTGAETLRFKLADDRMFSVDFIARAMRNSVLPPSAILLRKRALRQAVYFREIALENGEAYSFVENLRDYLDISEPSTYYLEMKFYPELYKSQDHSINSNRLILEVRPSPAAAASKPLAVDAESLRVITPESISPDRVVAQTIIARQHSRWDQYFLYMDIEQMLMRDPLQNRKYRAVSAGERAKMLETYRANLMQTRIDQDIVAIPNRFLVERTEYTRDEGTVTVIQWFKNDTFTEKKRYKYYVRERDDVWRIYDYSVENMGTE